MSHRRMTLISIGIVVGIFIISQLSILAASPLPSHSYLSLMLTSGTSVATPVQPTEQPYPATPTITATMTTTATATSTTSATATASATSSPTTTPITATSCGYVYPLGIPMTSLDTTSFLPPSTPTSTDEFGPYSDLDYPYPNLTKRRLYFDSSSGGIDKIHYLRWHQEDMNTIDLATSLRVPGNLATRFTEAPWPSRGQAPAEYPLAPGVLNPGDWILSNDGISVGLDVRTALQAHVDAHTPLLLPIYGQQASSGNTSSYQMERLGSFLLLGFGGSGATSYLDLVYIGQLPSTPCQGVPATPLPG